MQLQGPIGLNMMVSCHDNFARNGVWTTCRNILILRHDEFTPKLMLEQRVDI